MATAEALRATHTVGDRVRDVNETVRGVDDKVSGAVTDARAIKRQSSPRRIGSEFRSHVFL